MKRRKASPTGRKCEIKQTSTPSNAEGVSSLPSFRNVSTIRNLNKRTRYPVLHDSSPSVLSCGRRRESANDGRQRIPPLTSSRKSSAAAKRRCDTPLRSSRRGLQLSSALKFPNLSSSSSIIKVSKLLELKRRDLVVVSERHPADIGGTLQDAGSKSEGYNDAEHDKEDGSFPSDASSSVNKSGDHFGTTTSVTSSGEYSSIIGGSSDITTMTFDTSSFGAIESSRRESSSSSMMVDSRYHLDTSSLDLEILSDECTGESSVEGRRSYGTVMVYDPYSSTAVIPCDKVTADNSLECGKLTDADHRELLPETNASIGVGSRGDEKDEIVAEKIVDSEVPPCLERKPDQSAANSDLRNEQQRSNSLDGNVAKSASCNEDFSDSIQPRLNMKSCSKLQEFPQPRRTYDRECKQRKPDKALLSKGSGGQQTSSAGVAECETDKINVNHADDSLRKPLHVPVGETEDSAATTKRMLENKKSERNKTESRSVGVDRETDERNVNIADDSFRKPLHVPESETENSVATAKRMLENKKSERDKTESQSVGAEREMDERNGNNSDDSFKKPLLETESQTEHSVTTAKRTLKKKKSKRNKILSSFAGIKRETDESHEDIFKKPMPVSKRGKVTTSKRKLINKKSKRSKEITPTPFNSPESGDQNLSFVFDAVLAPVNATSDGKNDYFEDDVPVGRIQARKTYSKVANTHQSETEKEEDRKWEAFKGKKTSSYRPKRNNVVIINNNNGESSHSKDRKDLSLFDSLPFSPAENYPIDDLAYLRKNFKKEAKSYNESTTRMQQPSRLTTEKKSRCDDKKKWYETKALQKLAKHFEEISELSLIVERKK